MPWPNRSTSPRAQACAAWSSSVSEATYDSRAETAAWLLPDHAWLNARLYQAAASRAPPCVSCSNALTASDNFPVLAVFNDASQAARRSGPADAGRVLKAYIWRAQAGRLGLSLPKTAWIPWRRLSLLGLNRAANSAAARAAIG